MDAATRAQRVEAVTTGPVPAPITVLVVDPSDFSRACTVAGLGSASEFTIESCATIAQCERDIAADLILFQSSEGVIGSGGLAAQLTLAARRWPRAASLVVSAQTDVEEMLQAIRAGAQGLLTSTVSVECMRSAILLLVNGIAVFPLALSDYLRRTPQSVAGPPAEPASPFEAGRLSTLTKRQQDVLQLLALGFSNKAIAQRLAISESTVKVHIRAIMAQNGATNRTQLVAHFLKSIAHDQ